MLEPWPSAALRSRNMWKCTLGVGCGQDLGPRVLANRKEVSKGVGWWALCEMGTSAAESEGRAEAPEVRGGVVSRVERHEVAT